MPGHTTGHVSVFLPEERFLIAADALTVDEDGLAGPRPDMTADVDRALSSVARLADLDIDRTLCHHGGSLTKERIGSRRSVTNRTNWPFAGGAVQRWQCLADRGRATGGSEGSGGAVRFVVWSRRALVALPRANVVSERAEEPPKGVTLAFSHLFASEGATAGSD